MAVGPYGALLEAVRGVRWPARRHASSVSPGTHRARTRGVASEFAEYRPYRQGDDPRRIDWKLLARSDRAYTRLAPNHSVMPTTIGVDASASMAFPERPSGEGAAPAFEKWEAAKRIAIACAAIARASGDPVGLAVAGGGGLTRLSARTRRGIVAEIARTLDAITPRGSGSLAEAFAQAGKRVLLITDCLGDVNALRRASRAHVAGGGEVLVAHVVSRAELEVPVGAILATDPEDTSVKRSLTATSHPAYRAAFDSWRAEVAGDWRDDGIAYVEVLDDEPADIVVRRVVAPPSSAGTRA